MKKTISLVLTAVLALGAMGCSKVNSISDERLIPYPDGYDILSSGASSYEGVGNHEKSQYFSNIDYYNLKSNDNLTILSNFKTYQQTKEYSCGPASALMVLHHFGETNYEELEIVDMMDCHKDLNGNNFEEEGVANERGEFGTSTDRMVKFFEAINWDVTSSLTEGKLEDGYTFYDPMEFKDWVIDNLKNNTPIMVEWIDWAGHWQNIIGYDTMGTDNFGDDVIIFADAYDTSDHSQDGYYIYPAERFFYMWLDKNVLPEEQSIQQWVIAKPKK